MASTMNPLERKARISFIKGFSIAIFLGIIVIAILVMQLVRLNMEEKERLSKVKSVAVLTKDIKSGEILTSEMVKKIDVDKDTVPSTAVSSFGTLSGAYAVDNNDNEIRTEKAVDQATGKEVETKYIYVKADMINGDPQKGVYELQKEASGEYYYVKDQTKVRVELSPTTLIAKTDMKKNTILTPELVTTDADKITTDTREQEYNMITLSSDLKEGDFIDVRLRLPTGVDYVVLSKKKVRIPQSGSTISTDTIVLNLNSTEILLMSAAIIDCYKIQGGKLYTTKYIEGGTQLASFQTYIPSIETINLINTDKNQVAAIRAAQINLYNNQEYRRYREAIENVLSQTNDNIQSTGVQSGTTAEINKQQADRRTAIQSTSN